MDCQQCSAVDVALTELQSLGFPVQRQPDNLARSVVLTCGALRRAADQERAEWRAKLGDGAPAALQAELAALRAVVDDTRRASTRLRNLLAMEASEADFLVVLKRLDKRLDSLRGPVT